MVQWAARAAGALSPAIHGRCKLQQMGGRRVGGPIEIVEKVRWLDQKVARDLVAWDERGGQRDSAPVVRDVVTTLERILDAAVAEQLNVVDDGAGLLVKLADQRLFGRLAVLDAPTRQLLDESFQHPPIVS